MSQSQDERNSSDWLSCVSKKTGMPRLILSLILLSCAVMMIWLCLTAAVTSPDHRIKQESKVLLTIPFRITAYLFINQSLNTKMFDLLY